MLHIPEIVKVIRQLAQANPTNIARCQYYNLDEEAAPCCIVGHALTNLGVTRDTVDLIHLMNESRLGTNEMIAGLLIKHLEPASAATHRLELEWIEHVQAAQDEGNEWAVAVAIADGYCPPALP